MMRFLVSILMIGLGSTSWSVSKVPECQGRPEFLSVNHSGATLKSLESLPHLVFVGRKAQYYVEGKVSGLRILGQQSFTKGRSEFLCASNVPEHSVGYSMYAPTLIDRSGTKSTGDSFWQFHLMANAKQLGIWNQKSVLFTKSKDLESALQKVGAQIQVLQIDHDEYELILIRENDQNFEALSIQFDAVPEIP